MADTTLLYRPTLSQIDTIVLDASLSEQHQGENDITEHPVEKGSNIADHIRPKQDMLTLEALFSNTPLSSSQTQRVVNARGVQLTTNSQSANPQGQVGYAETAYRRLLDLKNKGTLFTVITALRTYDNMQIASISVPKDSKTGDGLVITLQLKQITIVENQLTKITVTSDPRAENGDGVNKGKQVAKTASKATENKSWAYQISDKTGFTSWLKGKGVL